MSEERVTYSKEYRSFGHILRVDIGSSHSVRFLMNGGNVQLDSREFRELIELVFGNEKEKLRQACDKERVKLAREYDELNRKYQESLSVGKQINKIADEQIEDIKEDLRKVLNERNKLREEVKVLKGQLEVTNLLKEMYAKTPVINEEGFTLEDVTSQLADAHKDLLAKSQIIGKWSIETEKLQEKLDETSKEREFFYKQAKEASEHDRLNFDRVLELQAKVNKMEAALRSLIKVIEEGPERDLGIDSIYEPEILSRDYYQAKRALENDSPRKLDYWPGV